MSQSLIVVESPTKVRTIRKYLGKDFDVLATMGHIKDLPEKKLGIDIEKAFEPTYAVVRAKKDTVTKLKKAANKASVIYLAPTRTVRARLSPGTSPRKWTARGRRSTGFFSTISRGRPSSIP